MKICENLFALIEIEWDFCGGYCFDSECNSEWNEYIKSENSLFLNTKKGSKKKKKGFMVMKSTL